LKPARKVLVYASIGVVGLTVIAAIGLVGWARSEQYLPSDEMARQHFNTHRADYAYFASLVRKDPGLRFIGNDGSSNGDAGKTRLVPEYSYLMRTLGAKFVTVRADGSMEFALWGFGCAICSDAYMGVRYFPADHSAHPRPGWTPQLVKSLDTKNLPRENGSIADGLYVVQLEPEWFIYRLQTNE
jgi:hypothetical protein